MFETKPAFVTRPDDLSLLSFAHRHFYAEMISPGHDFHWTFGQFAESGNSAFIDRIVPELERLGIESLYAPNVMPMTGEITHPDRLTTRIILTDKISAYRNNAISADTLPLVLRTHAFGMSNAGCGLGVVTGETERGEPVRIFAHFSMKSILNGVIDTMARAAVVMGARLSKLTFTLLFEIHPDELVYASNDLVYGKQNAPLLERLRREFGPESVVFHSDDTYLPENKRRECIDIGMLARLRAVRYFGQVMTKVMPLPKAGPFAYVTHLDPRLQGKVRNVTFAYPIV